MSGTNPYRTGLIVFDNPQPDSQSGQRFLVPDGTSRPLLPPITISIPMPSGAALPANYIAPLIADLRSKLSAPPVFTDTQLQNGYTFGLQTALEMALEWAKEIANRG